eukprot:CAMPEP_0184753324 /NCGR_PEP_ID=MMETSP0315-20130426/44040_1 /TAXON_ID=101924 /ORGANISM="Rhodosorus marinus, Strain UTEX LB 2760" /LENGTH=847 /DNA_ID=CAMNT_0027232695 /DNA_START=111 /DNA_END=2653 /DNA_ORIENTATION=+
MKFSKQLLYNAVAEWRQYYMDYGGLKKIISKFKKIQVAQQEGDESDSDNPKTKTDEEALPLLASSVRSPVLNRTASAQVLLDLEEASLDARVSSRVYGATNDDFSDAMEKIETMFFTQLEINAQRVEGFYVRMEKELERISHALVRHATNGSKRHGEDRAIFYTSLRRRYVEHYLEIVEVLNFAELNKTGFEKIMKKLDKVTNLHCKDDKMRELSGKYSFTQPGELEVMKQSVEKEFASVFLVVEHYLEIAEVLNFAELNKTGFEKIMKKLDKVTNLHCKDDKMRELSARHSFTDPGKLEVMKQSVEKEFARCFWSGDVDHAKEELRESLRELVIWERNTIWRDMLQSERRVNAVVAKKTGQGIKRFWMPSLKPVPVFASVIMFLIVLLASPALFDSLPNISHYHPVNVYAAQRSLGLVVLVSFLWATEAVPLYVTALAIPALSVVLNVYVTENGKRLMLSGDAAKLAVSSMCSSTILLIIGGYSIASALSKYALDKTVAMYVLAKAGHPSQVLLLLMLLAVFLSMWISNVATPVLLNSIMLPIVQGFSAHSLPFVKCLLLGIALSSNIGGMGTPIASPQNAIALSALEGMQQISFLQWTAISIPLMLLMVILGHALLMFWFRPGKFSLPIIPTHVEAFAAPHYLILGTILVTIAMWCWKPAVAIAGSEGIIACLPILVFYGSGLLSKEDFNNLPWNVIMLVAGGVSLGSAVEASKLLQIIGGAISESMSDASLWMVATVFSCFIFIVSSATSHTVSAIIILPLLAEIGAGIGHPRLMVMGGALACSCAMALPVSSFPNTAAVSVENELGKQYLQPSDIVTLGVQMTVICATVLISCGYGIMFLMGF